jgi:hypothetical protein
MDETMTEDMQIQLRDALAARGSGQVRLKRHLDGADMLRVRNDSAIAAEVNLFR